ncbi:hypothetical protein LCGC14_0311150 [marine sediment metagenome]|uniref:Uncharacterized protein n=1 Tax=marine sediment metagenome TaxID=412755 RepID=A0A0F9U4W0_9ZZZZ
MTNIDILALAFGINLITIGIGYWRGRERGWSEGYEEAWGDEQNCCYPSGWDEGYAIGYETGRQDEYDDPEPRGDR